MIFKLPALGIALAATIGSPAAAHESCATPGAASYHSGHGHDRGRAEARGRGGERRAPAVSNASVVASARAQARELRRSDQNRDGRVTLREALRQGRRDFARQDRDGNRVLTRSELSRAELARDDRNRDGRVSFFEHQSGVRARLARFDTDRDGRVATAELRPQPARVWRVRW